VSVRPAEAHLFTVRLDDERDPARLDAYRALLAPEELARGARYVFERNRHEHLVAHALKRRALSRFAPAVAPAAWRFVIGEHGKPAVADAPLDLRFNLSHTEGLVACIVAAGVDVGVDVETVARKTDTAAVAHRFFAVPEVAALRALPEAQQHDRFFEYWTLKEAYIKARGMGLAIPLGDFWFTLAPPGAPTIGFAPRLADDPGRWAFFQGELAPHWRMAAAVERIRGEPELTWHRGMP
jgi:4'-phosphopantetheinyl transferase